MAVEISDPMGGSEDLVHGAVWHVAAPGRAYSDMHRAFEVNVILSGRLDHMFEGFSFSSGPGDIVVVPAWEPHAWRFSGPHTTDLVIHFIPDFLHEERVVGLSWLTLFARPPRERPRIIDQAARREMLALGQRLRREVEERPRGWQDAIRIGLLSVLLTLVRGWSPPRGPASGARYSRTDLERILPALTLVHGSLAGRVGLDQAASACGLSKRHFATLFRQTMGLTFARFAVRTRIKEAAELLHQTDLPVETIAERCGFVDHSHLCRLFRKAFGCTPGAFRESGAPDPQT
jgi:AraC-like DNA-binding protein/quercetin dioxygenase-like cupin family protein